MEGLKAKYNNIPVCLQVKHKNLLIITKEDTTKIPISDIKSLQTKNTENLFYLRIKLNDKDLVIEFSNYNTRDMLKSLLMTNISGNAVYKEIDYDTNKFINSLSPPLLSIFSDMGCTVSQFYNYLIQSNFYDVRNKFTSIDRLINEKLRDFKVSGNNSLLRINNYSLLTVNEDTSTKEKKILSNREVQFEPIYNVELYDEEVQEDNMELEVEESLNELEVDQKEIKKLVELGRKRYRGEELDVKEIELYEKYKDIKYLRRLVNTQRNKQ